jgi:hypothetical protein
MLTVEQAAEVLRTTTIPQAIGVLRAGVSMCGVGVLLNHIDPDAWHDDDGMWVWGDSIFGGLMLSENSELSGPLCAMILVMNDELGLPFDVQADELVLGAASKYYEG